MDSDIKAPAGEPVNSDSADEVKVPVVDEAIPTEESQTTPVDFAEADSPKADEPSVPEAQDSSPFMGDQFPAVDSAEPFDSPVAQNEPDSLKPDTSTESEPTFTAAAITSPMKIQGAHRFIYGYVGLVVLVAAVVGVYVWQHNQVSSMGQQVTAVDNELTAQQQKVSALAAQLSKVDNAATSATPAILELSVVKATKYTPKASSNAPNTSSVAVDVSITNPTTKSVGLIGSTFKLKDALSNSSTATDVATKTTDSSLPSGYSLLVDQSLASQATTSGTLEFTVASGQTSFTLIYNSQTIPVTIANN